MGIYFNPDNGSFAKDKRNEIYIDKTGLISFLNKKIKTSGNCICVSHARRFGKSHAAGMIDAYYSCGSDSYELFKDTEIAGKADFEEHLNKYNVIHLDIASVWDFHKEDLIEEIHKRVCKDFKKVYGDKYDYDDDLYLLLNGISEDEVRGLCERYSMDFDTVKTWYNGYLIDGMHMYNPNSVSLAMEYQKIDSYWKNTSSFSSINTFITMNYDGLKDDVMSMLSGGKVRVNVDTFQNDLVTMRSKDEVLTALIHLGYIAFDQDIKKAFIPNYEVSKAFEMALITGSWSEIAKAISTCDDY